MRAAVRCGVRTAQRSRPEVVRALSSNAPAPPPPKPDVATVAKIEEKARQANRVKITPDDVTAMPNLPGRLPENKAEVAVLRGQPEHHRRRTVTISQDPKSSMTSFRDGTHTWHLRWKDNKSNETNPLMGWQSTSDPLAVWDVKFDDPEQAIKFCEKNDWDYVLEDSAEYAYDELYGKKAYSYNFLPEAVLADLEKNKTKTVQFARPGANASHYFRPLNFHGTARVEQHGPAAPPSAAGKK